MARALTVRKRGGAARGGEAQARLSEAFLAALAADYAAHGAAAIAALRTERPHDYVKLVAGLMPKGALEPAGGEPNGPTSIEVRFVRPES